MQLLLSIRPVLPFRFYIFNLPHSKYILESLLANENFSGLILRFCRNVTSGLSFLHEFDCIPQDLAARCCQVTSTMEVKVLITDLGYLKYGRISKTTISLEPERYGYIFRLETMALLDTFIRTTI